MALPSFRKGNREEKLELFLSCFYFVSIFLILDSKNDISKIQCFL